MSRATFQVVLNHETNHAFWQAKFGSAWTPNWVLEGMANLVAPAQPLLSNAEIGAVIIQTKTDARALEYVYQELQNEEDLIFKYSLWRAVIADLCPARDATELIKCLDQWRRSTSKEKFDEVFLEHFGVTLVEYFTDFTERLTYISLPLVPASCHRKVATS